MTQTMPAFESKSPMVKITVPCFDNGPIHSVFVAYKQYGKWTITDVGIEMGVSTITERSNGDIEFAYG